MEDPRKLKLKEGLRKLRKAIGDRVRKGRKSRGYTQEAFQEHCGIGGRGQMSDIECGKKNINLKTLHKLAHEGFGMTVSRFLSGLEKETLSQDEPEGKVK